jgi:ATP-dependent helicase/nuclease subunit A
VNYSSYFVTGPQFTEAQLQAIEYRAMDACVVAGPGSGKTTVLVERFRRLIEDHQFNVREILAITFTEKAAANMKAKLAEKFTHDPLRLRELEAAWVSTIHGFCARFLKENAIAAGIDPRFVVLDARESDDMQFDCLNSALDTLVAEHREDALALIETLQTPWITGDLKSAYDAIRSAGKTVEDVRAMQSALAAVTAAGAAFQLRRLLNLWPPRVLLTEARRRQHDDLLEWAQTLSNADQLGLREFLTVIKACPLHMGRVADSVKAEMKEYKEGLPRLVASATDTSTAPFRAIIFDVLAHFDTLYNERKRAAGALDFNDLERRSIELLRRDSIIRDRVRNQFRQIMLDEFQDINKQQAELIRLIRSEDVFFAVGDVNQSIYGFRHAQPDIFHHYRKEVEEAQKQSTELLHNFRSRGEILSCVETLLNDAEGIESRELIAGADFAEKQFPSIEVMRAVHEDKDEACLREARWIAHRVLTLRGELQLKRGPADFRHFAVLCRNGDSMTPILKEFDDAKIPYVCGRRQSFLLSREGHDITALLRTMANPRDGVSLGTLLRSVLVGLSDEALLRLRVNGNSVAGGLKTPLTGFAPADSERLERFNANLRRWRSGVQIIPLDVLLSRALSDCGLQWIPGTVKGDNIEAFLHLARTRGGERSLLEFLRELESMEGAVSTESELSDDDQGNCVQVMTAHAAKGLEFPITIIAAMDKGTQRSSAAVTFTAEVGLGIKWKDPFSDDGLKDSWALANSENLKRREKEEMSRLLYVAMTRAEEHLILSYSAGRQKPGGWAKTLDEHFGARVVMNETDPPRLTADERSPKEVPILPRPVVQDQHDTAVNVTSLALFAHCPRKYYIQRYLGWSTGRPARFDSEAAPREEDDGLSASELGSVVHEVLSGKPGEYPTEALALAEVFTRSALGRRAAGAPHVAREWDFIADLDGTLVRGSIDLWFEEDEEIFLVDYKTDAPPVRPEEYAPQLAIYALAIERAFGVKPAKAYLHFLRPDIVAEVPLDPETVKHARNLIAQLRVAQNSLQFDLNEGEHCRQCQYFRSLCPAGTDRV